MTELIPGVGRGSKLEAVLLNDKNAIRIGAVHRIDYHEAVVLTHDRWKRDAGGIPQFSFLLATARDVAATDPDDDEVLLLRVDGTASLSMEADLHAVREESLRTALSESNDPSPGVVLDMHLDPFTKNRISFTGLRCKILGTFYEDVVEGTTFLQFGADVDNFYATATYRVLKPVGAGLEAIASFLKPSPGRPVQPVTIGTVRYSATRRRAKTSGEADAKVSVNIHDFIGQKTGLIGMTRTGKSNTAKTIIARTFAVSERDRAAGRLPIGQLIFDPQGEYANDNPQDESAIAAIGERHVRIFQFGADGSKPHVRPLGINFFDEAQIEAVQGLIADQLKSEGASQYVNDFAGTDFKDVPGDMRASIHASRGRLALYAALVRAGFDLPSTSPGTSSSFSVRVNIKQAFRQEVETRLGRTGVFVDIGGNGWALVRGQDLVDVTEAVVALREADNQNAKDFCKDVRWSSTEPIFTGRSSGSRGVRGWRNLLALRPFHNPSTAVDPAREIYDYLLEGKIVIVDLHVGTSEVVKTLSESITRHLLREQTTRFTSGVSNEQMPRIQLMLEEAHNLFSADRYRSDADVWVRLAKEASKLQLGMTYATQEVSGVAHQVKANTANWVVAHLNNRTELNDLSKFYDFGSFADSILSSEDRGYVRLKTLSSPYIVPVQIDRYGLDLVNEARAAAGDPPLRR
jgi:hypothetical protein